MEFEEIQQNEVEALKAIYAADYLELPTSTIWNQRSSPRFKITLRPSSEFSVNKSEVEIQITMTATYPKTLPQIEVSQYMNLSGRQIEVIKGLIDTTVKELKGNEMIFEVTSNIQNELDEWARSVSKAAPNLELDRQQRIENEEQKIREQHEAIIKKNEDERLKEEQKFDSLILEELRKNNRNINSVSLDDMQSLLMMPESAPGVTTFQNAIRLSDVTQNKQLVFRQVISTLKIQQAFFGNTWLAKALLTPPFNSDCDVALKLTKIGLSTEYWRSSEGVRSLNELNGEMDVIRRFKHAGVTPLYAFSIERFQNAAMEWEITLLLPYSNLTPLSQILDSTDTVTLKTVQSWSLQLLEALETLHKAGLRHKCICPENVMIHVNEDTGEASLQLSHPQYLYTLFNMNESHPFDDSCNTKFVMAAKKSPWIPPEGRGSKRGTPTSKWDIWQLGALILQMLIGKRDFAKHQSDPEAYLRSKRPLPHNLNTFLLSLLNSDPAKRPSALELLTDEFFRTDFELKESETDNNVFDNWSIPVVSSDNNLSVSEVSLGQRGRRLSSNEDNSWSRYKHDFDEGIMLGRGGFGEVVKARNKLDGRVYAVKKITATAITLSHILQEVVLLSRLNHQYVVRYYTVWLEDNIESAANNSEDEEEFSTTHKFSLNPSLNGSIETSLANSLANSLDSLDSSLDGLMDNRLISDLPSSMSFHSLDLPSASQDFMSDSGFVQFEFGSDEEDEDHADHEDHDEEEDDDADQDDIPTPTEDDKARPKSKCKDIDADDKETVLGDDDLDKETEKETEKEDAKSIKGAKGVKGAKDVKKKIVKKVESYKQLPKKTLYIQMEYCQNHTLADLIKQGLYKHPEQYWRLLRQILVALAYIHSEGVIHRDLKPKNIFIDQGNNIKIGDFGLARQMVKPLQSRQVSSEPNAPTPLVTLASIAGQHSYTAVTDAVDEDLTTDVGTSLYAAVEMSTNYSQQKGYNEKVDIFSLGIIFLEMVWEMDTEMERVMTIRKARLPQIELPQKLTANKDMELQVEIIRATLNHDPKKRPSAGGLLKSGRIPVEDREMTVQDALQNIRDPKIVQQLAAALFSQPLVSAQQVLYDRTAMANPARRQSRIADLISTRGRLAAEFVERKLQEVFRIHGAVDNTTFRSKIFPRSPVYRMPTVVELVDPQGMVLQLPHDLTLPHARRLAETVPEYRKSYAFDTVYRTILSNPGRHPAIHTEVDFDITSVGDPDGKSLLFDEAETIAVMYDAAASVLSSDHELVIVVGHYDILSAALYHCGSNPAQYYAALGLLSSGALDRPGSSSIAKSNISTASLDMLAQFGFREQLDKAETRLNRLMNVTERVRRALLRIKLVVQLYTTLVSSTQGRRTPPVYFSPLIHTSTADFYTNGIMFQLVDIKDTYTTPSQRQLAAGSVLAVGGRYDNLIKSSRNQLLDARTPLAHAVGFGMSTNKLAAVVERQQYLQQSTPPRCEVLVSSLSSSMLRDHGAEVLKLLWRSGISADVVPNILAVEDLVAKAIKEGSHAIVLLKQFHATGGSSSRTAKPLRVKRLSKLSQNVQNDVDLTFNELVPYLKQEIQQQPASKTQNSEPLDENVEREREPVDTTAAGSKTIVMNDIAKIKGGRKNKWQLEVKATEGKRDFLELLNQAPVISLDLRNDVIEAICTVSASSTEDWKRRVVGLSPNQKAYIMNVQAKLATEAAKCDYMLLYSSKTEDVFIYRG